MKFPFKEEKNYKYIDEGNGEVLILLHGLFGALSNWYDVINHFKKRYRVILPILPLYDLPLKQSKLDGLVDYVQNFIDFKKLKKVTLIGNSLGGHIGLLYSLKHKENVKRIVLTGSSGLFEDGMGASYPKRGNYQYVKERVGYTFYDPAIATKEVVDEVYETIQSRSKCMRIIYIARSAQRHNVAKLVGALSMPTLLVWGLNDTITPPRVAHEYDRLMPNTELRFIDKCGHVPMMEHPELFNNLFEDFLSRTKDDSEAESLS